MRKTKYSPIQATQTTYEKLKYLAQISGKSKARVLSEVIEALFLIAGTYDQITTFDYELSALCGTVTFQIKGKNRSSMGLSSIPDSKLDEVKRAFGYDKNLKDTREKQIPEPPKDEGEPN